jgi:hypothetical protein
MQLHADWAITLACGATCPYVPTFVEDWDIQDPAVMTLAQRKAVDCPATGGCAVPA